MTEGPGPVVFVVQTRAAYYRHRLGDQLVVSYSLALPLTFTEPHYARLANVLGFDGSLLVLADFVADSSHLNGRSAQFLGVSPIESPPLWVPLASNFISSVGNLFIENCLGETEIPLEADITLVIEIAPKSWIASAAIKDGRGAAGRV